MVSTCPRCGSEVRVAPRAKGLRVRLDFDPDNNTGTVALVHGFAMKHEALAAARLRERGVPLYAVHKCQTEELL